MIPNKAKKRFRTKMYAKPLLVFEIIPSIVKYLQ
jgi:hypothetical protein